MQTSIELVKKCLGVGYIPNSTFCTALNNLGTLGEVLEFEQFMIKLNLPENYFNFFKMIDRKKGNPSRGVYIH